MLHQSQVFMGGIGGYVSVANYHKCDWGYQSFGWCFESAEGGTKISVFEWSRWEIWTLEESNVANDSIAYYWDGLFNAATRGNSEENVIAKQNWDWISYIVQ